MLGKPNVAYNVSTEVDFAALDQLRPSIGHCLHIWDSLRGDRWAPSLADIDLPRLPADIVPYVTITDVRAPSDGAIAPEDVTYRYWGTAHVRDRQVERTGKSISSHPDAYASSIFGEYRKLIEERRPILYLKYHYLDLPFYVVEHYSLRMPLTTSGDRVENVISVAQWTPLSEKDPRR